MSSSPPICAQGESAGPTASFAGWPATVIGVPAAPSRVQSVESLAQTVTTIPFGSSVSGGQTSHRAHRQVGMGCGPRAAIAIRLTGSNVEMGSRRAFHDAGNDSVTCCRRSWPGAET